MQAEADHYLSLPFYLNELIDTREAACVKNYAQRRWTEEFPKKERIYWWEEQMTNSESTILTRDL